VSIEGTVDSFVDETQYGESFYISDLRVDGKRLSGSAHVPVVFGGADGEIKQGKRIVFKGDISKRYLNPKSSFSVSFYTSRRFYSAKPLSVITVKDGVFGAAAFRQNVYDGMSKFMSKSDAGTAYALIFGDNKGMDDESVAAFKSTGLTHIFAVSGLHYGFLFTLSAFILDKLKFKRQPYKNILIFGIFIAFAFVCGFSPSIMRSVIMITVYMYAESIGRKRDALNTLCFAAVIILIINPLYLFDIGFELSLFAVLGITLFYRKLRESFSRLTDKLESKKVAMKFVIKIIKSLVDTVCVGISANIGVFPLICFYFGGLPIISILSNVIVVPVVSVLFPFVLVVSVLGFFLPNLYALFSISDAIIDAVNKIVGVMAKADIYLNVPFGDNAAAAWFLILLYYFALIYFSDIYRGPRLFRKLSKRHVDASQR
jgi:competence protein ComEC